MDYKKYNIYLTNSDKDRLDAKVKTYKEKGYSEEMIDRKVDGLMKTLKKRKEYLQNLYETSRKGYCHCEVCDISVDRYYFDQHCKSKKHMSKISQTEV